MIYKITAVCPNCQKSKKLNKSFKHDIIAKCRQCARPKVIGKTHIMKNGYVQIQTQAGWKYEHIYNWVQQNGEIPKGHIIHHLDHIRTNNVLSNLQLMTKSKHDIMTLNDNIKNGLRKTIRLPNQKDFDKEILIGLIEKTNSIRETANILAVAKGCIIRNLKDLNINYKYDLKKHKTIII